jgi:hypothetical protein
MIQVILIDTETNGLPLNRFAPYSMHTAYPAVLQLSWAIYTIDGTSMEAGESRDITIALNPAIPWNAEAAAIHKIPEEVARQGTPAKEAFQEFATILAKMDVVIAHNLSFDKPVLRAAAYAEGIRDLWPRISEFCTMRSFRDICCLPSEHGHDSYKLPRLNELYTWCYGHPFDISGNVMHTSKSDTQCLADCLRSLLAKGCVEVCGHTLRAIPSVP